VAALSAQAGTITINSTTLGGPTWNRPVAGGPPVPPLSGVGTAVAYDVFAFTVDTDGNYTFLSTATSPSNWDNYSFLYQISFSPVAQFTNILIGNDDNPNIGLSGFSYGLTAGMNYFFVATGFANGDAGDYSLEINGPGEIIPGSSSEVPEPATASLFLLGGAGLLWVGKMRRR
jgi:hypothetical protein